MHAGDIIQSLRNLYPAWEHGDIGDEADVAHKLIALAPGIAAEHVQLSLIRREAEDGIERSGLACSVGADESKNATLFNSQIDSVERDGWAKGLAQVAGF